MRNNAKRERERKKSVSKAAGLTSRIAEFYLLCLQMQFRFIFIFHCKRPRARVRARLRLLNKTERRPFRDEFFSFFFSLSLAIISLSMAARVPRLIANQQSR